MLLLERKKNTSAPDVMHFIGIGGIGMSGIAEVMHNLGYRVQGSDAAENYNTSRLRGFGIKVFTGHNHENITEEITYVVTSSAITGDNVEVKEALNRKIPVIKRSEMLAELMRLKCSVAIAGSHGKTTTTSLMACLFEAAGLRPTVINGGIINNRSTNAYIGSGDYLIAEADESDATFIHIPSTIGIITNIDPEHLDYYHTFDNLLSAFKSFIMNLPFYGFGVACIDHPIVRELVSNIVGRRVITYGIDSKNANVRAFNIRSDISSSTFNVEINLPNLRGSTIIEEVTIPTPGRHNVLNSLAAIAVGAELDFGLKVIKNGFKAFKGVKRRFTKTGEYKGATIIDDYAHHPVEVEATLATAKTVAEKQGGKVIAIFQPHRYSRMQHLFEEFTTCFKDASKLYITDVYGAGEKEIEGVSGLRLVEKIQHNKTHADVSFIKDPKEIIQIVKAEASSGDIILMMGAGSISAWANNLPEELKN